MFPSKFSKKIKGLHSSFSDPIRCAAVEREGRKWKIGLDKILKYWGSEKKMISLKGRKSTEVVESWRAILLEKSQRRINDDYLDISFGKYRTYKNIAKYD